MSPASSTGSANSSEESGAAERVGVVIPTYDEGVRVGEAVDAVRRSAQRAGWDLDVVVVDDGSTEARSLEVLEQVDALPGVRVLRQRNRGRFLAREAGLRALETEYVLLLDARVEVDVDALPRLRSALREEVAQVWNLDVTPGSRDLRALFWTGITKVWWREYFRDRRHVVFGLDDFDRFPKGTGAFFAPRALLLEALGSFESLFDDPGLASDDTRLLREVARRQPIHLTPEITCRHHLKSGWRAWGRQCFYRGTTFVDGYLDRPERAVPLLAAMTTAGVAGSVVLVRFPRSSVLAAAVASLAAGGLTSRCGGTRAESAAVSTLAPGFAVLFGAGIVRGLRLAGTST